MRSNAAARTAQVDQNLLASICQPCQPACAARRCADACLLMKERWLLVGTHTAARRRVCRLQLARPIGSARVGPRGRASVTRAAGRNMTAGRQLRPHTQHTHSAGIAKEESSKRTDIFSATAASAAFAPIISSSHHRLIDNQLLESARPAAMGMDGNE